MPFKIEWNDAGIQSLLKSPEMQKILNESAQGVKNTANMSEDGYESDVKMGKKRAYVNIYCNSEKAYRDNLKNNTLLKALGSGRRV